MVKCFIFKIVLKNLIVVLKLFLALKLKTVSKAIKIN